MLSVRNLTKKYGTVQAVQPISFEVQQGDFFTLLGPSGCGKTTTLQCIAGLETPSSGEILVDGKVIYSGAQNVLVPANKRRLGMVFQSYAIWPHMSVFENVAFPLLHGNVTVARQDVRPKVMKALSLVKLSDYADRPSPHLSGGQQQRIALARALVHEPRLLLLDEPLSNLDEKLRESMRSELRLLVKSLGITTIFVTHDQTEALSMSDGIALMRDGQIVQMGSPRDIYLHPTTSFSADFMGRSNLISGVVGNDSSCIDTEVGKIRCEVPARFKNDDRVYLVVRPRAITVHRLPCASAESGNSRTGTIRQLHFLGDTVEAEIAVGSCEVRVYIDPFVDVKVDDQVRVDFPSDRCVVVSQDGFRPARGMREIPVAA
ncbi:ABC transporter ATP-binding protein [Mesorhizobium sp. M7A.F.Ca.US.006.01.1.1]|uniref:ABC transporter ATP-binding protein n=1 Tax=Mesorhizobium sp. M7A.F.Ca.US.006.01.1.1 TaxID=2496707 RepID=UPI000FCBC98F|nr:ABC transporter ATP-binding protein [Mesorhizobium sp. M7A.F.Ca.US.006.01.1.1]RUZ72333.1 ABC transporter ATP-binding protein [Mesorhizobium sp. M7A.F.Ca.US.006.01.1.1]